MLRALGGTTGQRRCGVQPATTGRDQEPCEGRPAKVSQGQQGGCSAERPAEDDAEYDRRRPAGDNVVSAQQDERRRMMQRTTRRGRPGTTQRALGNPPRSMRRATGNGRPRTTRKALGGTTRQGQCTEDDRRRPTEDGAEGTWRDDPPLRRRSPSAHCLLQVRQQISFKLATKENGHQHRKVCTFIRLPRCGGRPACTSLSCLS